MTRSRTVLILLLVAVLAASTPALSRPAQAYAATAGLPVTGVQYWDPLSRFRVDGFVQNSTGGTVGPVYVDYILRMTPGGLPFAQGTMMVANSLASGTHASFGIVSRDLDPTYNGKTMHVELKARGTTPSVYPAPVKCTLVSWDSKWGDFGNYRIWTLTFRNDSGRTLENLFLHSWEGSPNPSEGFYDSAWISGLEGMSLAAEETITVSVSFHRYVSIYSGFPKMTYSMGGLPKAATVTPIEGANRYTTAIAASKKAFASSEYVVIATGANWPDALGGSALAGALDAPILLTRPDTLPAEVRAEIVRLGATKAIVLGSAGAVSNTVYNQIDAIAGVSVERIAGPNRYDTANLVAARTIAEMNLRGGYSGTAFIATGANFPDALGASPLAAAKGWPIYLANPNQGNNAGLIATMRAAGVTDAILLGGANVVADSIRLALGGTYETRLAGANRYDTAVKVAAYGVANAGLAWNKVAIATGQNFPDALAGGVLQGKDGSVLLLTPTASLNDGVASVLRTNKASILEVRFLGSTGAVSQTVRNQVTSILQ